MNENVTSDEAFSWTVTSPATGQTVWQGQAATPGEIDRAVKTSRDALERWSSESVEQRLSIVRRFAEVASDQRERLAASISAETGKPRWEAIAEAKLVPAKVQLAIQAYQERCARQKIDLPQGTGYIRYRSIGVLAVLGPFNFPAHLPNGHLVPALLAGNTVLFKPSEATPGTGQLLADFWSQAGLPEGVLQVLQGGRPVGTALVQANVDGVLFTGSRAAGTAIHASLAGRPEIMLALEMGGNNPLVVHGAGDLQAAAYWTVVSSFISAGQRCTCARRLILPDDGKLQAFLDTLVDMSERLRVGLPDDSPEPFMGPVISAAAAQRVLEAQDDLIARGGTALLRSTADTDHPALLTPAIIDVTEVKDRQDEEIFGPLLQVIRTRDFEHAIREANQTAYGLSASLLSDDLSHHDTFRRRIRAGVVNCNQPTTGASGRLPFGGLGASGNHRPSGYFAADYCADATAGIEIDQLTHPDSWLPGLGPVSDS